VELSTHVRPRQELLVDALHEPAGATGLWTLSGGSRKSVPELVEERVLELVRSGELNRGDRLPNEPELARLFGVARSSVRTGLQRLQGIGVVEVNRGRGWFVSGEPGQQATERMRERIDEHEFDLLDVLETRIALEAEAAALAAARATDGQLDQIVKLSRGHRDVALDDREALLETDEAFHAAIIEASGNRHLQAMYGTIPSLIADFRRNLYASPELHDRSAIDHNQVVVQIRRRDEVGARLTMTSHLMCTYTAALRERGQADGSGRRPAEVSSFVDVRDSPLWSDQV
jgi:GntR family transcriptional repressor for pyruvate dehydrogenase complex